MKIKIFWFHLYKSPLRFDFFFYFNELKNKKQYRKHKKLTFMHKWIDKEIATINLCDSIDKQEGIFYYI